MRVLVTGGYGLIGSAVLARLHRDGHEVIGGGRSLGEARRRFPYATWIEADFARLSAPDLWQPLLAGIDAVVNCVGVLQDNARDDVRAVHVDGTCALFDACKDVQVRRVIHISAIGAAPDGPTEFARTKAQADAHLAKLDLDWVILRPALVLAPSVYGGSAMLHGLAGLPLVTPLVGASSQAQIVSIDDVTETVSMCLRAPAPTRAIWDVAHPKVHSLSDIISALRQWLGFPPAPIVGLPVLSLVPVGIFAGFAGVLGWRSPARATALAQLGRGVVGDPSSWIEATGISPRSLDAILADRRAGVQDRWFARLYWLKPVAILALAGFWIATGVVAMGPGRAEAVHQLMQAGLSANVAELALVLGAVLDMMLGLAVCVRHLARHALQAMLLVSAAYLLIGTMAAPQFWFDPLGPYLKIIPVMLATTFTLAILDER